MKCDIKDCNKDAIGKETFQEFWGSYITVTFVRNMLGIYLKIVSLVKVDME